MSRQVVLAVGAHPDDIEFMMAGTLLSLKDVGYDAHYLNVANGSCGSALESAAKTVARRTREARKAAFILGACFHPSITSDLEIFYELTLLRRVAAIIREVNPTIVLTHSLDDYMEDHMNTARLVVSATFARGMRNFVTLPRRPPVQEAVTIYHALPHGLRDQYGKHVSVEAFVDVRISHGIKLAALAAHESQGSWLGVSQNMDSYLKTMYTTDRQVGALSGKFVLAEGWRRHNPIGFSSQTADPLQFALRRRYHKNLRYSRQAFTLSLHA